MYSVKSGLRKALYMYSATPFSRFENEEYSSCIALWGMHFLSIHGSYDEFGRIIYHLYVNIYPVHQLYDS